MSLIEWQDDYSVGVHSLDTDHQLLISLVNQIGSALGSANQRFETVASILNALQDYAEYHFAREEALMAACYYPELPAHKAEHEQILAQLLTFRYQFTNEPGEVNTDDLLTFLVYGFKDHMLEADKDFEPYMANAREAVQKANEAFVNREDDAGDLLFLDMD